jgi:hypothetical protein
MASYGRQLRQLLESPGLVVAPGAYDGLTARLVAQRGFPAVYMTGAGTAAAAGLPDYGLLTMTEMADNAARIADAVDVPVIADADTGFGNELNVVRAVRAYTRAGVAALHIEDQEFPKRCGHLKGKRIIDRDPWLRKIRAAAECRPDPDLVIIARSDARGVAGLDEALDRANKDIALALIGRLGASAGAGYAVEYAGPVIDSMDMEGRFTLCNLTVELGAKYGLIAPDDRTAEWIRGRRYAPAGAAWDQAVEAWARLRSDPGAGFDREEFFDVTGLAPMVTWGTSPEHAVPIDGAVPEPADAADDIQRMSWVSAQEYMGLEPGQPVSSIGVDWVFIGSCANSRLGDLRAAAEVVAGRRVAPGVTAWVVPGSEQVQAAAEAEGLADVFVSAGFEWRAPGCSMCVAANGDRVPPGARCVSTSNRNFVGRQGPGARTHLASPATAAAAAVSGRLVDVRSL